MGSTTVSKNRETLYKHSNQYQGQPRAIKIIVVGAGISGIAAVKLFKDTFTEGNVELIIYEKNHDIVGTWLENRYPGVLATFQHTAIATRGKEIQTGHAHMWVRWSCVMTSKVERRSTALMTLSVYLKPQSESSRVE
ncbi:hypothetical protein PV04_09427 [Phialophora macrospora]|uniref:FAD/NAD(P)-binding domain-containing protein n=1 Tax=Phialophora macrospora TaxID=1851006 RepID=A0A0D2F946_9EURO|nr:hypothetical protein PV04_09427 [Phialophora macrospora]